MVLLPAVIFYEVEIIVTDIHDIFKNPLFSQKDLFNTLNALHCLDKFIDMT